MKKKYIVKEHKDFSKAIDKGKYYKDKAFVLYCGSNGLTHYRFGISIGKKVGNAVTRNKIKRQMRMIIDDYKKNYQNGLDYIIIIKCSYISETFSEIKSSFENIIDKINKSMNNEEKKNENK